MFMPGLRTLSKTPAFGGSTGSPRGNYGFGFVKPIDNHAEQIILIPGPLPGFSVSLSASHPENPELLRGRVAVERVVPARSVGRHGRARASAAPLHAEVFPEFLANLSDPTL